MQSSDKSIKKPRKNKAKSMKQLYKFTQYILNVTKYIIYTYFDLQSRSLPMVRVKNTHTQIEQNDKNFRRSK